MNPEASARGESRSGADPTSVQPHKRRAPRTRGLLATAGALAIGVSIAVLGAGVTFAYLNASSPVAASGTITAGTSGLNVQYGAGAAAQSVTIPAAVFQNMLPGDVTGVQINVINTGDVPQGVTARISVASAWETRLATGACPVTVLASAALTTTASASTSLATGATQNFCLQVTLPAGAAAASEATTVPLTITLDGTQLTS